MSWKQTDAMHERHTFIADYQSGLYSITELAERYSISRKTAHKWINRFEAEGSDGLCERSRAPKSCPHRTDQQLGELFVQLRRAHPSWGSRKLREVLRRKHPALVLPAASTIDTILARHRLLEPRRRQRRRMSHPGSAPLQAECANAVWCIDFKGEFRLGNGAYCYPLTITDAYSRYILCCDALANTGHGDTQRRMQRVFQEYGLPAAIRSDNGVPFTSQALGGLSRLNVWWMKLGIIHQRIRPAHPQENGRHERMHRTLKAETTRPPAQTIGAQQRRFSQWRRQFNQDRPHQAIAYACPARLYLPSLQRYPSRLPEPQYDSHCEVRRVSTAGAIRFANTQIFLSSVLAGEHIGLEEIDDGIWNVLFFDHVLGRLDQPSGHIV